MTSHEAPEPVATLIGDLVGSRTSGDRRRLHRTLLGALVAADERTDPLHRHRVTAGDEFQATFAHLGQALRATLLLRLALLPGADVRFGLGWGEVTELDASTQDGPGWWSAREAITWAKESSESAALRYARAAYRRSDASGPAPEPVNAALLCRDQMVGCLDDRSLRILRGLMDERSQSAVAATEGISPSAVSQRVRADGLAVIVQASRWLGELR